MQLDTGITAVEIDTEPTREQVAKNDRSVSNDYYLLTPGFSVFVVFRAESTKADEHAREP
jgi:hypothetical protein